MSYARKNLTNVLGSIAGLIIGAAIALWQFYLFVTFRDANGVIDMQAGRPHLWFAIVMALLACVAAFFVFSLFLKHDTDDELHITS